PFEARIADPVDRVLGCIAVRVRGTISIGHGIAAAVVGFGRKPRAGGATLCQGLAAVAVAVLDDEAGGHVCFKEERALLALLSRRKMAEHFDKRVWGRPVFDDPRCLSDGDKALAVQTELVGGIIADAANFTILC